MIVRHGDLLLKRLGASKKTTEQSAIAVLAHGEHSGHMHRVHSKFGGAVHLMADAPISSRVSRLNLIGGGTLKHEFEDGRPTGDHDSIDLDDGEYAVIKQREYDPRGERLAYD